MIPFQRLEEGFGVEVTVKLHSVGHFGGRAPGKRYSRFKQGRQAGEAPVLRALTIIFTRLESYFQLLRCSYKRK